MGTDTLWEEAERIETQRKINQMENEKDWYAKQKKCAAEIMEKTGLYEISEKSWSETDRGYAYDRIELIGDPEDGGLFIRPLLEPGIDEHTQQAMRVYLQQSEAMKRDNLIYSLYNMKKFRDEYLAEGHEPVAPEPAPLTTYDRLQLMVNASQTEIHNMAMEEPDSKEVLMLRSIAIALNAIVYIEATKYASMWGSTPPPQHQAPAIRIEESTPEEN